MTEDHESEELLIKPKKYKYVPKVIIIHMWEGC